LLWEAKKFLEKAILVKTVQSNFKQMNLQIMDNEQPQIKEDNLSNDILEEIKQAKIL